MASAAFVPNVAMGLAQTMGVSLERAEALSRADVPTAVSICWFLRGLFASARTSLESELCGGVDCKEFAARHQAIPKDLDASAARVAQLIASIKAGNLGDSAAALVPHLEGLQGEIAGLTHFLVDALAKAQVGLPVVDMQRIQAAKAAFERGETKPFVPAGMKPAAR